MCDHLSKSNYFSNQTQEKYLYLILIKISDYITSLLSSTLLTKITLPLHHTTTKFLSALNVTYTQV